MSSILHGLYSGQIIPWERRSPNNQNRRELLRKIESEEKYFIAKMSLEDCQRFQALSQLHTDLAFEEENSIFSYGFTLGLLLMMDVTEEAKHIGVDAVQKIGN